MDEENLDQNNMGSTIAGSQMNQQEPNVIKPEDNVKINGEDVDLNKSPNPSLTMSIAQSAGNVDFSPLNQKSTKKEDITDLDKVDVDKVNEEKNDELMECFKTNFNKSVDFWQDQKDEGSIDMDFYLGYQWDVNTVKSRDDNNQVTTCANKIATPINKILADFQKNPPRVSYKKGYTSKKETEVAIINAIADKIQNEDFCLKSYTQAFKSSVITGEGYLRAYIDYETSISLRKDIKICAIENNNCVFLDPDYKTNFDFKFATVISKISKEEYKRRFKKSMNGDYDYPSYTDFKSILVDTTTEVMIAEHFYIEEEEDEVYQLDNGLFIRKTDYDKIKGKKSAINKKGTRTFRKVKHLITDFEKVLELKNFPGEIIPVFPCFASEAIKDNKKIINGAVRRARNPQQDYNYFRSTLLDLIDKMPKLTWMSGEGQLTAKTKRALMEGNKRNALIEYKTEDSTGTPIGKPERVDNSVQLDGVISAMQIAEQDIQNAIGIFDTTLGNDGAAQEESGIARMTKAQQSEENNFYLGNAFSQTLRLIGKFLINIIPMVYNDDRTWAISVKNGTDTKDVSPKDPEIDFLDVDYGIDVSITGFGKNERQEEFDNLLGLIQISPEILPIIADLVVEKSGLTNSEEISERLIAAGFVNPAALTASSDEKYSAIAALQQQIQQAQQAMTEMQAQNEQLTQQLNIDKQNYSTLIDELNSSKADVITLQNKQAQNINDNVVKLIMKLSDTNPDYTRFALQYLGVSIPKLESQGPLTPEQIPQQYTIASVNDPITQMQQQQINEQDPSVLGMNPNQQNVDQGQEQQPNDEAYQSLLAMMPNIGRSA